MSKEPKQCPSPFQLKTCWAALSGICLLTIITLVCAFILGLGYLFVALEAILLPLIIAGILAYLLHPLVIFAQKRLKKRALAVLSVLALAGVIVTGFGFTIVPPLVEQTGQLISARKEIYTEVIKTGQDALENPLIQKGVDMLYNKTISEASEEQVPAEELQISPSYIDKLTAIINYNTSYLIEKAIIWLTAGTKAISGVAGFVVGAIMIPVFLFYFLLESEKIATNWHTLLPLRHSHFKEEVVGTLQDINNYIISFIRGQMLVSLIDGTLLAIGLKIIGLPYAITIGAATAILGIIPYIGTILTCLPALFIAWFTWQDPSYVIGVACIFIFVNQFDGWIIQPRIVGQRVGMHDMVIMFSVLFWSIVLGGIVGALLAVPLTASLKVIFTRYVWTSFAKDKNAKEENLTETSDHLDTLSSDK